MLSDDFIYRLKAANPIESVMGSYVQLIRAGGLYKCLCPFHSEKSPSCVVYANTQDPHFYCFGCHAGGDVISFIRQMEGIGYMDAVRMLAERAGLTVPSPEHDNGAERQRQRLLELNRAAAKFYCAQLLGSDQRGLKYLMGRALKPEIIRKYGIGYAGENGYALCDAMMKQGYTMDELIAANLCGVSQKSGRVYDKFRSRVIFPIMDLRGSVIAFGGRTIEKDGEPKYLNSADTPVFKKGRNLFSMHFAKKSQSKRLILAEGYMDVIAVNQAGFDNVVASLGTALTADQCRLMRQYAEEVVISYDSDAAGQNATVKAINLLRAVGLRPKILHLHDAKDPDEFIKKFGAPAFRALLEKSDDALSYELERCKTGADTNTEDGMVTALHKAVSVLAGVENELDRNVYLSKIAKEYGVPTQVLNAQVDAEMRKRRGSEKKQVWNSIKTAPRRLDPVNPEAASHLRESAAEEQILCYLFRQPDALHTVREIIPSESFVTSFHKRVYAHLADCYDRGQGFSMSLFAEDFTPQESGAVARIAAKFEGAVITEQSVRDCAGILRQYAESQVDIGAMDNDTFAARIAALRERKG